ncbi:hypothetical protein U1Q18_049504, partial [Sarracenia purpurea var. burkii]
MERCSGSDGGGGACVNRCVMPDPNRPNERRKEEWNSRYKSARRRGVRNAPHRSPSWRCGLRST